MQDNIKRRLIPAEDVQIINDMQQVPTIFLDGAQGFTTANGVSKINLYQVVQDIGVEGGPIRKLVVARLAMTPTTAEQLANWLLSALKDTGATGPSQDDGSNS